jgi:hypothetical protein
LLFIIAVHPDIFNNIFHRNIAPQWMGDMSSTRINPPLQHICSNACRKIQLCTAMQHTSSLAYLEYCEIPSCASIDAALNKVIERLRGNSRKSMLKQWLLLRKRTISEVEVSFVGTHRFHLRPSPRADHSQLSISQLETQSSPYLVRYSQKQPLDVLTKAVLPPNQIMAHTLGCLFDNQHLVRSDPASGPSTPQKALLLGWERDTRALAYMIGTVTLLSVLAGFTVGVLVHNASLGIAASSALAATLSCVEMLVIWHFR